MKKYLIPALKLSGLLLLLVSGVYTCVLLGFAQIMPGRGLGKLIVQNGKPYYANIGQSFTRDRYFWGRPSAVNYNAAGSGGSNKGPFNPEYLKTVQARIDTFLVHNPGISLTQIPVDLITASGSGLDPDISEQAALVQVQRIATTRHIGESELYKLVKEYHEKPFLGMMGPGKINVLQLNLALDRLEPNSGHPITSKK